MSSAPKVRVGVVGVGYLGAFHVAKYARMEAVELAGLFDTDGERAAAVAAGCGVRSYPRLADLIGNVDAVSIAVPTAEHFGVARYCLDHGVDVLVEKPLTATLEEADQLIALAAAEGRILQVGHLERFNPAVVALRDEIREPLFIESHRLSLFKDRSTDVSVVLDLMIHDIDIILNFVASDLLQIHAAGAPVICDQVDIANARLEFASGCVANVTASRISTKNQRKLRLFQKDAYLSIDFAKREFMVIRRGEGPADGPIPNMRLRQSSFSETDALELELAAFVSAVARREPPPVTGEDGRRALAVALEIMDQIDSKYARHFRQC